MIMMIVIVIMIVIIMLISGGAAGGGARRSASAPRFRSSPALGRTNKVMSNTYVDSVDLEDDQATSRETKYFQVASQEVRPNGPDPWKVLAHVV